jgi:hypothetical protein
MNHAWTLMKPRVFRLRLVYFAKGYPRASFLLAD